MPAVAPVLHYVLHDNITPAQRAQLSKSHKKVEQLLGVTPSLRPIPPSAPNAPLSHRRSQSNITAEGRTKSHARERGKLSNLFNVELRPRDKHAEETEAFLHRVSTSSSATSSSSSSTATSLPDEKPRGTRYPHHRPPRLNLSCSNLTPKEDDIVSDISKPAAMEKSSLDSPLFKVDFGRQRSRTSIIEEREWSKIVRDVSNLPVDSKEKSRKLNRLGKVFGVLPPLEMVFPPSPTSRSRFDPKRYTFGLPPPLVRGTLTDDLNDEAVPAPGITVQQEEVPTDKVIHVVWDTVTDEAGRQKVMDALRVLRH